MSSMQPFDERTVALGLIATVRATMPGVKGYPYPVASLQTPCIIPTMGYEMNKGLGGTVGPIDCNLLILANTGDGDSGARMISELVSGTGERSIKIAIETDPTLDGTVRDCKYIGPLTKTHERYDGDGNVAYYGRYVQIRIYP